MKRTLLFCLSLLMLLATFTSASAASRFVDNGDQTVTDTVTGLMWTKNANLAGTTMSWDDAFVYAASLNSANGGAGTFGHKDWRDPTVNELMTLVDTTRSFPALPAGHPFLNVQSEEYWSSTSPGNSEYMYANGVNMAVGIIYSGHKYNDGYVWPVRGVQTPSAPTLTVTPASADFGTLPLNTSSSRSFTLGNSGTASIAVTGISLSGNNSSQFTLAPGSCGTLTPSIAPGNNCAVSVSFTPTSPGGKSATLRIAYNDPVASIKDIALTGAGADSVAPVVTSFSVPASSSSLTVAITSFTATDNVAVTGYCVSEQESSAGCSWSAAAPTQYSFSSATPAARTLHCWAKDAAGNIGAGPSPTVTLALDQTAPALTVSTLAHGSVTGNSVLNIAGSASDNTAVSQLTVAGLPLVLDSNGMFNFALQLQAGATTVTTVATDAAGNRTVDTRTVEMQQSLPLLIVSHPADNGTSNKGFVTVSGETASGIAGVTVSVNGGAPQYAAMEGTAFTATVNLGLGINTIQVTAQDGSGKSNTLKRTVLYDPQKPTLNLDPEQDLETGNAAPTISGTIADAVTPVTVRVSDGTGTFTPAVTNGSFSQPLTLTATGKYTISVTVTEANGNQTTVQRNIFFKKVDPATRFSDNGDQTVTDNSTGLTWTKNANLPGIDVSWQEALDYVSMMNSANAGAGTFGHNDWRLPGVEELETLVDTSHSNPALPAAHPFTGVESDEYWSSSVVPNKYAYVFGVDFYYGQSYSGHDYNFGFVWPVRGQRGGAITPLTAGITGSSYSETLSAGWGTGPYTWTVASGSLPPGLTLDSATGAVTGTATRAGVYSFSVRIVDATSATETRRVALTVTDVACGNGAVRIAGTGTPYADIADAYGRAADRDIIQLQALDFSSDILFERNIEVTLQGGFDCGYTGNNDAAGLLGTLRLRNGKVKVENLVLR